jgi:large subunit ribosomal protein L22
MEFNATSKYVRVSTRKMRLVADAIRKLSPSAALLQLNAMPKVAAEPIAKVIASAMANAVTKGIKSENLLFKRIEVMGGPVLKRWNPVSRGQAHAFKKRMTHICVVLTEKDETKSAVVKEVNQKNAK